MLPAPTTYDEFKDRESIEKIGLVTVNVAKRQILWTVVAGNIYSSVFTESPKIILVEDNGVALTEVFSAAVTAGEYFHDKANGLVVLELSGSGDPTTHFMAVTFRYFFSNVGVKAPHDLASGFDVEWLPLLKSTSLFRLQIDNQETQLGSAIEGPGSVTFHNDQDFWKPRFDKFVFENKLVTVFSWNRDLPTSEAKMIYRGRVQGKTYNVTQVSLKLKDTLNELRAPVPLPRLGDLSFNHDVLGVIDARVPQNLAQARERLAYGRLNGFVLQNIDQVLADGYPLIGTVTVTNGSATVTGVGVQFDIEVFQGDKLIFSNDETEKEYEVKTFSATTILELGEVFDGPTNSGVTVQIKPQRQQQWVNRWFKITNHALTRPTTTISTVFTARLFTVADGSEFKIGDAVIINGDKRNISALSGITGDLMELDIELSSLPAISDTVSRSPMREVYLDGRIITEGTHFVVNDTLSLLQLNRTTITTPEFFLAGSSTVPDSDFDFTIASNSVSMTFGGTDFLTPGDWVLDAGGTWLQIWAILDEDNFITTANATASGTVDSTFKSPDYVKSRSTVLSSDIIGKSDDGTTTGDILRNGPEIVKDILEFSGLSTLLNVASFTAANDRTMHEIGLAIPAKFNAKASQKLRDIINQVNRSIFGVLFQNSSFQLEYDLIEPGRDDTALPLDRADALNFSITSSSKSIVSTVNLFFNNREFDNDTLTDVSDLETFTSLNALRLAKTNKEIDIPTLLTERQSAVIFASRWAFILEFSKALVSIDLKLQAMISDINDRVDFNTSKLYERLGTSLTRKIGLISMISKGITGTQIKMDDLAGAFTRCSVITENTALAFVSASDDEKIINGYITQNIGTLESDTTTFGINLIW